MAFHEVRFPTDISFGSSGGPEYSTDIITLANGFEHRNINWSAARSRYNAAHGVKTQAQLDVLTAFFRARRGRAHGFRFKDWSDYKVTAGALGTGNGSITQFQLVKIYTSGGIIENRTVKKPVSGTVNVYANSVLQTSGYTVDYATGIITFASAPASGVAVTADFEFDVPVRFDSDKLSISLDNYGAASLHDVSITEIRV